MSIFKLNFIPIRIPANEVAFRVGQIYTYSPPVGTCYYEQTVQFNTPGNYEIEYWAIDDAGNEEPRKRLVFDVVQQKVPIHIDQEIKFQTKLDNKTKDAILEKGNVQVIFSKTIEGMGIDLKWSDLDINGLKINSILEPKTLTYIHEIEILSGSQLARCLNNFGKTITVSVKHGEEILLLLGNTYPLTADGELLDKLPKLLQNYIEKVYKKEEQLFFNIKRACKLKIIGKN